MNKLNQLKTNLQYWENLAMKSHLAIAASMVPVFFGDSIWAVLPLGLVFVGFTFVFFKHMAAKHRVLTFGREN